MELFQVWKFLSVFQLINCIVGDNCDKSTWNQDVLENCCDIPDLFVWTLFALLGDECEKSQKYDNCLIDAVIKEHRLLDKNKNINIAAIKKLYHEIEEQGKIASEKINWSEVIDKAIDNCTFEKTDEIMENNLKKYYSCIVKHMSMNCLSFLQITECEDIEEKHESCMEKSGKPFDCLSMSENLNVGSCCNVPELQIDDAVEKCKFDCYRNEIFVKKRENCTFECATNETGLVVNGKFNFEKAKIIMIEKTNNSAEWEKSINFTFQKCEEKLNGKKL